MIIGDTHMKKEIVKLAALCHDAPHLNHSWMEASHEQKLHLVKDLMQDVNGRKLQA